MEDSGPREITAQERQQSVFFYVGVTRLRRLAVLLEPVTVKKGIGGMTQREPVENLARIDRNARRMLIDGVGGVEGNSHAFSLACERAGYMPYSFSFR
jgi:hypothetical protein